MKKKNSQYGNPLNCGLRENIVYEHFREEFITVVDKFNSYNQPITTKITENGHIEGLTKKDNAFFAELYVPSQENRTHDNLRTKYFPDLSENDIGTLEWQILQFCVGFEKAFNNNRIIFLIGNIGQGKSSIVNYTLKYLYLTKKSIKNRVIPIILNCQGHYPIIKKNKVKEGNIDSFIDSFISNALKNRLKSYIVPDNEIFWEWYEKTFQTEYSSAIYDLRHSKLPKDDFEKEVIDLRTNYKKSDAYFLYHASYYIVEEQKKDLIFIFDNVDPFEVSIIEDFFWKAKFINNNSPIKVIISLRHGTYRKLQHRIDEISIVKTLEISTDLSKILEKRCKVLEARIAIQEIKKPLKLNSYGTKSITVEIPPLVLISKIIKAILNPKGLNCITTFSCKNIRNELEFVRMIFSSGLLSESELGTILLSSDEELVNHPIPPEYLISIFSTNGLSTFFTEHVKNNNFPGIINILSCTYHQNPIQIFTKLFILNYLSNAGYEIGNNINTIKDTFSDCLDKMKVKKETLEAFQYSFYRLFNIGLVTSPDLHIAEDQDEFVKEVQEVRISKLGIYYFTELLTSPFYLIYVKDDVYLTDPTHFEDAHSVLKNHDKSKYFWTNFKNLCLFLKQYGYLELVCIKHFIENNQYDLFMSNFGCSSDKLFTIRIIRALTSFIKQRDLKSDSLIYFLDRKQTFHPSDTEVLQTLEVELLTEYGKMIK
jgi:hypothetical protein